MSRSEEATESAALDAFLRSLAHTLRTPVSITLAWSGLLRDDRLDPARRVEALLAIEGAAREQARLIDLLGDAARLLGGRVELNRQPTEIAAILEESTGLIGERAESRGIALHCTPEGLDGAIVEVDADRLRQALSHLLANALQATRQGGRIDLAARRIGERLSIEVRDDGCGIDPRLLPHCLTPRMHAARAALERGGDATLPPGGVGLGLLMVERIAALHGGSVTIDSAGIGRGTTATMTLPLGDRATR